MLNCQTCSKKIFNIVAAFSLTIFFLIDRLLKQAALSLPEGASIPLIKDLFSFSFIANYRIALSLPLQGAWLNYLIALVIIILAYQLKEAWQKRNNLAEITALSAIILGAASNLSDRLSRGYVIDYLELNYLTAFNLADILISAGAVFLIIKAIFKK